MNKLGIKKDLYCIRCLYIGTSICNNSCKENFPHPNYKPVADVVDIIPLEDEKTLRILW